MRALEGFQLRFELVGRERVVGVEKLNIATARSIQTAIARVGKPAVFLFDESNSRVRLRQFTRDLATVVARAVVDDEAFPIGVCLRLHALHGFAQKSPLIETRHDD